MQFVTIVLSLFMTVVLGYDEKYDKIDVDKILSDDALLTSYLNCFLDKGPCTEEYASEYKGTTAVACILYSANHFFLIEFNLKCNHVKSKKTTLLNKAAYLLLCT